MGANSSTPQNPSDQNLSQPTTPTTLATSNMSSAPQNSQNPDRKMDANQNPDPKIPESQNPEISDQPSNTDEKGRIRDEERENVEGEGEGEGEEEEGECGFCLFMKGGGCKDAFVAWEQCVEEAEKSKEDIVEKCFEVTGNLKKCMEAHSDYYEPILRAEKETEEEFKRELEREAEEKNAGQNSGSKAIEESAEIEVQKEG